MPTYGTPQAGYNPPPNLGLNLTHLEIGDFITLVNASDAHAAGFKSVAFARGMTAAGSNTITFTVSGGTAADVVEIEAAAFDLDGNYTVVGTIVLDANGNGAYTDIGASPFYRALLSTYTGGNSIVTASRL